MATHSREMAQDSLCEDILKTSLKWLSIQLSEKDHSELIALLRDPIEAETWRSKLIAQLTAPPVIYCAAINNVLSITEDNNPCSFQYLFETLARKGVFLDDCDDMIITETILSVQQPFSMLAHQIMINAIMKLYILTHVSIHSIISEVRRVTTFTASKELPSSSNEALLLWVSKISNHSVHKMKGVQVSPSHFTSSGILEVVSDGQLLASLLHFYLPSCVKWNDFYFSSSLLPEDKSLHNVMMVKTIISSNTSVKCHFDPHLILLSTHEMLHSTFATGLELNVFVFLSSLFCFFKQYVSEQHRNQQLSNDDSTIKHFTASKLPKRKDLQKGLQPVNKPPLSYLPVCISREGLTHTVSDSSLCARHASTSSNASSISLIDFSKDPSQRVKLYKNANKQQITASSESLNMVQFETHTSLRIKRPSSGQMTKEHVINKMAKSVSFQEGNFTDSDSNHQIQSAANVVENESFCQLVKAPSSQGVTLEVDSITDEEEEEEVVPTNMQDVPMKHHMGDNIEDENSQESVRVGNISMLEVKNIPSKQIFVEPKQLPNSDHNTNHSITHVINKTHSISPDSHKDHQIKSQDESEKTVSSNDESGKTTDQRKDHTPLVIPYVTTAEDMKIIAATWYEYIMDMLGNWDSLPVEVDDQDQACEEKNKIVCHLDDVVNESAEKPLGLAQHIGNDEDMQCVAMACYEAVMDILRHDDIQSVDSFDSTDSMDDDKHAYYLGVENNDSYETPLYAYPPSLSTSNIQQYSYYDKKTTPEVVFPTGKTANQQAHSLLFVNKDTAMHCDVNTGGLIDSIVSCNKETNSNCQVEQNLEAKNAKVVNTLKVDDYGRKKSITEEISSNNFCVGNTPFSNHPFSTFIDISDSKHNPEHMKVLESRQQKIKRQLLERDNIRKIRIEKKGIVHNSKDPLPPQSSVTKAMDPVKHTSDVITKNSKHSVTTSEEGHTLHFTLGSHNPSRSSDAPLIVNIPSTAMTTALPEPPGMAAVVKTTLEDHPFSIPYDGPPCYVQPPVKSNKKIICNALSYTCLAGVVNNKARQEAVGIVESSPANHFLVLFRDHIGCKFRGIYSFDDKEVHKIFGAGPKFITSSMISRVYKYNSGSREFKQLPSISISTTADGFTIHNYIWVVAKNKKRVHY